MEVSVGSICPVPTRSSDTPGGRVYRGALGTITRTVNDSASGMVLVRRAARLGTIRASQDRRATPAAGAGSMIRCRSGTATTGPPPRRGPGDGLVNTHDHLAHLRQGHGRFRLRLAGRISGPGDLVNVVRHRRQQPVQREQLRDRLLALRGRLGRVFGPVLGEVLGSVFGLGT